jgi:hypothetical protein
VATVQNLLARGGAIGTPVWSHYNFSAILGRQRLEM